MINILDSLSRAKNDGKHITFERFMKLFYELNEVLSLD